MVRVWLVCYLVTAMTEGVGEPDAGGVRVFEAMLGEYAVRKSRDWRVSGHSLVQ